MIRRRRLKALLSLNVIVVLFLVGYKVYLNVAEPEFQALHADQVEAIEAELADRESFSFAVVGNINNSIGIFERRIVPRLNNTDIDFLVSAGNAVSGGGEDKYRALHGTLGRLEMPYLLTFGAHEEEEFGAFRFYEHFGPYLYSFRAADSRFVFLDTTGTTSWRWQVRWLETLLERDEVDHTFLFTGHPLRRTGEETIFTGDDDYIRPVEFRRALAELATENKVDAIFSANVSVYSEYEISDTEVITTGGAGGLVLNDEDSFYHFVRVTVSDQGVTTEMVPLDIAQNPILERLEGFWFFVHSLFYVGYINFILIVGIFILVAAKLYSLVFVDRDYYPDYDLDPSPWIDKPLRVAMFTDNYLPFIGGVPLSIERLKRGLTALGNSVLVVAPGYKTHSEDNSEIDSDVRRVPSLLSRGKEGEFPLANVFLPRIRRWVREFAPDIIHVHHPVWMGAVGASIARRRDIPVVYTYHTRIEHYAHFVPLPGKLFRNLLSHALIKRFSNRCDGVIVPTYSAEEYMRIIGVKSPIFVQPTGIEYDRLRNVDQNRVQTLRRELAIGNEQVLVSVSRLSTEKNIDFMIDAVASLRTATDRPFRFLIIGDGHERDRLAERIQELGLTDCITLLGAVRPDEIAVYYHLADLLLFASRSETQGMVILEAMAAGLPVVAVRSSGIDDIVREGVNGYKTRENREQWRDRVAALLEDDTLRNEMSAHAKEFAGQYSVDKFAANIKEAYASVIASATSSHSRVRVRR